MGKSLTEGGVKVLRARMGAAAVHSPVLPEISPVRMSRLLAMGRPERRPGGSSPAHAGSAAAL